MQYGQNKRWEPGRIKDNQGITWINMPGQIWDFNPETMWFIVLNNYSILLCSYNVVGGFNPSEKYVRQIGSFPQVGVKKKYLKPPVLSNAPCWFNHHLVDITFPDFKDSY